MKGNEELITLTDAWKLIAWTLRGGERGRGGDESENVCATRAVYVMEIVLMNPIALVKVHRFFEEWDSKLFIVSFRLIFPSASCFNVKDRILRNMRSPAQVA